MSILYPEQQCNDRRYHGIWHPFVPSMYESRNENLANFLDIVHAARVGHRLGQPSVV